MSNFHKKNRTFRTLDLIGLFVLVGLVCSISGVILAQAMQDDKPHRAQTMAEALAKQIRGEQQNKSLQQNSGQRGPASVSSVPALTSGTMSKDPWGQPYHYLVRKVDTHNGRGVVRIFVWSDGPDGKAETDPTGLEGSSLGAKLKLRGDDLGFVEEYAAD